VGSAAARRDRRAGTCSRQFLARSLEDYLAEIVKRGCFIDVKSKLDSAALQRAALASWE
jgi:hypothetical protein